MAESTQRHDPTLGVILMNPPTGDGQRSITRLALAAQIIGCESASISNLFPFPTKNTGEIAAIGNDEAPWLVARTAITSMIESEDEILLAWGVSKLAGAAGAHQISQIRWVVGELARQEMQTVWLVGGQPRHPSRWHQFVSDKYARTSGGTLERRLTEVLTPVNVRDLAAILFS